HPALQRLIDIVVGIRVRRKLSKGIWSRTAAAVLHAGSHKEPHEKCRLARSHGLFHAVVIIDGALRRQSSVTPAVIHDELSATRGKRLEVGINGIEGLSLLI